MLYCTISLVQIEVKNVYQQYGSLHAVNGISLKIPEGKIFGIIGKSGAGKSTLLRMISLLEAPEKGEVYFDDTRVDNLPKKELIQMRRKIGMIFQNFNLFSSRSSIKNIAYPLEIAGINKKEIEKRTHDLLSLVGLSDKANVGISTLSGGQKQRIAIARALANNPSVLFCDEATSALDPLTTRSILMLIKDIQKKLNLTVVMVTHQMEVVRDSCDYVAVLDGGKVVEEGDVEEVFGNPQSEVTRSFILNLKSETQEDAISKGLESKLVQFSKGGQYVLLFPENKTNEPVLSKITKNTNATFNIHAAGTQYVKDKEFGSLLLDISGEKEECEKALSELRSEGIIVSEVKNV